jgi:hypothetical protein
MKIGFLAASSPKDGIISVSRLVGHASMTSGYRRVEPMDIKGASICRDLALAKMKR